MTTIVGTQVRDGVRLEALRLEVPGPGSAPSPASEPVFSLRRGPTLQAPSGPADPALSAIMARTAKITAVLPKVVLPTAEAAGFVDPGETSRYQRLASDVENLDRAIALSEAMASGRETANDLQYVRGRETLERHLNPLHPMATTSLNRASQAAVASLNAAVQVARTRLTLVYLDKADVELGTDRGDSWRRQALAQEVKGAQERLAALDAAITTAGSKERPLLRKARNTLLQALVPAQKKLALLNTIDGLVELRNAQDQALARVGDPRVMLELSTLEAKLTASLEALKGLGEAGVHRGQEGAIQEAAEAVLGLSAPIESWRAGQREHREAYDRWARGPRDEQQGPAPEAPPAFVIPVAALELVRAARDWAQAPVHRDAPGGGLGERRALGFEGLKILQEGPVPGSVLEGFGRDLLRCITKELAYAVAAGRGAPLESDRRERSEREAVVLLQLRAGAAGLPAAAETNPIGARAHRLTELLKAHDEVLALGLPMGPALETELAATNSIFERLSSALHVDLVQAIAEGERNADAGRFLSVTEGILMHALPLYKASGAAPEFYRRMETLNARFVLGHMEREFAAQQALLAGLRETPPSTKAIEGTAYLGGSPPDFQWLGTSLKPELERAWASTQALHREIGEARAAALEAQAVSPQ